MVFTMLVKKIGMLMSGVYHAGDDMDVEERCLLCR